jgi:hypothetical protein
MLDDIVAMLIVGMAIGGAIVVAVIAAVALLRLVGVIV